MSRLCILLIACIATVTFSQEVTAQKRKKNQEKIEVPGFEIDPETNEVVYTEAVTQAGSAAELYEKGIGWFNAFYKSPSSVIKSKEAGKSIQGVGLFWLKHTDPKTGKKSNAGKIQYYITLKFKDGRYKYTIDNVIVKKASRYPITNWINAVNAEYDHRTADFLVQTDNYFRNELMVKLKKMMAAQKKAADDDW